MLVDMIGSLLDHEFTKYSHVLCERRNHVTNELKLMVVKGSQISATLTLGQGKGVTNSYIQTVKNRMNGGSDYQI